MPWTKEKRAEYMKEYCQKNKEKKTEYDKLRRKNNYKKVIKMETISNWKRNGLICEDFDKLYNYYLSIDECENCGIELNSGTGTKKCMDHSHETSEFRNILCMTCNFLRY